MNRQVPLLDISNKEYHQDDAKSSTDMRNILKSEELFMSKLTEVIEPTKAMQQGTALHTYFLERDKFKNEVAVKNSDIKLTTKAGKEWVAEQKDKIIIDEDFFNIFPVVEEKINSKASDIFREDGIKEASFFWDDKYDIKCKCRPDYLSPDFSYMIDLKTTADASPRGFKSSVIKFNYAVQAQFYIRGIQKYTDVKPSKFYFIVIEKTKPYHVELYDLDETWLSIADKEIDEALYRIDSLRDRKYIPNGYTIECTTLHPPDYLLNRDNPKVKTGISINDIPLF
tara:strand:+ start:1589 stop:2437 length:849 start_codon:yes stop_codon:yes gene_type:complete